MRKKARAVVFLDRDDTVIRNIPYLGDPEKVELFPQSREALLRLKEEGWGMMLVSNQSGVGRGLISKEQVKAVNDKMELLLGGDIFEDYFMCYASPLDPYGAEERKPSPALLLQARDKHDLDLSRCYMIGDKDLDVLCGKNAGCRSILVLTGEMESSALEEAKEKADFVANDLKEAVDWILEREKKSDS